MADGHIDGQSGDLPLAGDAIAAGIWRGAARRLIDDGHAVLAELPLGNGRRADLVAIDRARDDHDRRGQVRPGGFSGRPQMAGAT